MSARTSGAMPYLGIVRGGFGQFKETR
jgi:hypothetical protein